MSLEITRNHSDDDDPDDTCQQCGGSGEILVCCDDLCQGQGYCIHGDGVEICPACHGSGERGGWQ